MKWFRKKRKPPTTTTEVPLTTMLRWMLYDVGINDDLDLTRMMGLMPVSKEGDDKETEDSEDRLSEVYDILPFADMISDMTASVLSTLHYKDITASISGADMGEEDLEALASLYKSIAITTLITALSTGVHLGLLEVTAANYDLDKITEFGEQNEF